MCIKTLALGMRQTYTQGTIDSEPLRVPQNLARPLGFLLPSPNPPSLLPRLNVHSETHELFHDERLPHIHGNGGLFGLAWGAGSGMNAKGRERFPSTRRGCGRSCEQPLGSYHILFLSLDLHLTLSFSPSSGGNIAVRYFKSDGKSCQ